MTFTLLSRLIRRAFVSVILELLGTETHRDYLSRAGNGQLREPFDVPNFWLRNGVVQRAQSED